MTRLMHSLSHQHDHTMLIVAALVCAVGSCLTVMMARRMLKATEPRKRLQLGLTSLIGGSTVWSTHFIAMLSYSGYADRAFEPILTGLSLLVAVLGLGGAFWIMGYSRLSARDLAGGAVAGISITSMHFIGMAGLYLPGRIVWSDGTVLVAAVLGIALSMAAFNRILRPVTRLCWLGGTVFLVAAICAMHFTAMTAFTVVSDPAVVVPQQSISDAALGLYIVAVVTLILLIGFATVSIEPSLERETRDQLQHAAQHDPLTGLANRAGLGQMLLDAADRLAADERSEVAVLTIDLDGFKQINDLYGHAVGDETLRIVAARLLDALGPDEDIARAGGDEFIALKRDFRLPQQVAAFAERLLAAIRDPLDLAVGTASVGASIGIASSLDGNRDVFDLQHRSDLAMYRAKTAADQSICEYSVDLDAPNRDRLQLIEDLRHAVVNGELELAYQSQNALDTLADIGFEVLLRWNHPARGRVPPDVFIPLAEESGLIREIGLWVLETACAEAATWDETHSVAVNVSPRQLVQPNFVDHVARILRRTGLSPRRLELEITEASIIDDQANTLRVMTALKAMGLRIAMDDFGTGYSSLAMLQVFPSDRIKIDRSFIANVHTDKQRAAIVRSTLILGEALGIPVLAEGVEVEPELDFLRAAKCDAVQGFYFSRPIAVDALHERMAIRPARSA